MIVVTARIEATEATIAAMKSAIAAMEQASRTEAGCLDYTFSVELNDPTCLRITEKWESMDVLRAHFATPHMQAFRGAMSAHPPKSVEASFFEATEVAPPGA